MMRKERAQGHMEEFEGHLGCKCLFNQWERLTDGQCVTKGRKSNKHFRKPYFSLLDIVCNYILKLL